MNRTIERIFPVYAETRENSYKIIHICFMENTEVAIIFCSTNKK